MLEWNGAWLLIVNVIKALWFFAWYFARNLLIFNSKCCIVIWVNDRYMWAHCILIYEGAKFLYLLFCGYGLPSLLGIRIWPFTVMGIDICNCFSSADVQSGDTFQRSGGPKMVMAILSDISQSSNILNGGFSVVAAAATGNEIVKESFMELKIDELMLQILRTHGEGSIHSLYDAIRILLTPDDNRVVASQASNI